MPQNVKLGELNHNTFTTWNNTQPTQACLSYQAAGNMKEMF